MSPRRGAKGPIERAVKKKNMEPILVDPALDKAYRQYEKDRQDHIRMHRMAGRDRSARGGA